MENQPAHNLEHALDELFSGAVTHYTTSAGTRVNFPRTGIKQLGKATAFVNKIAGTAVPESLNQFLALAATEQKRLLEEGKSVHDINLNHNGLLETALGNHSLLLGIFSAVADVLPEVVAIFSTITEAEYESLSLDEQLIIAAGILIVNYSFFTQSLPPIIKSAMRAVNAKQQMLKSVGKQTPNQ